MIADVYLYSLIMTLSLFSINGPSFANDKPHREQNALYRQLLEKSGGGGRLLPAPTFEDGMNAEEQRAAIDLLLGERIKIEEFLRKSVVSSFKLVLGREPAGKDGVRVRSLNLWFVAYGNLNAFAAKGKQFDLFQRDEKKVKQNVDKKGKQNAKEEDKQDVIPVDQLAHRGIGPLDPNVSYTHSTFTIMDRVRLRETFQTQWSQTADSVVIAGTLDPKFAGDSDFPNCWNSIGVNNALGPVLPYNVQFFYLKATRLVAPAGAVLVEYHLQYEYPPEWFEGHDLLTSKLGLLVETSVRSFRRRLPK